MAFIHLSVGDPAPSFVQRSTNNERFVFNAVAGRYILLCFMGSAASKHSEKRISAIQANRNLFDDKKISFFGISIDPDDEKNARVKEQIPGIRYFWDIDKSVSRLYGALPEKLGAEPESYKPFWVLLDPALRVLDIAAFRSDHQEIATIMKVIRNLPALDDHAGASIQAPVLILPRVFEPDLCKHLIGLYQKFGGEKSGFMRQQGEKTVLVHDESHKKRKDFTFSEQIEHEGLRTDIQRRVMRRIVPEIKKAFQFEITRMERYIVSCYESEDSGFFRAHRDNTTKATAHRRFACTINLNAEDFEGGELRFPEFGSKTYRAPTGGAVVFSCSLLHEATPVTQGKRYAFLPFFYDEAAKKIRDENAKFLDIAS